MEIQWDQINRDEWEGLADLAKAPMGQRWVYGEVHASLGGNTHRAVIYDSGNPVAICQCLSRKFAGFLNTSLATRGPVWIAQCNKPKALNLIRRSSPLAYPRVQLFTANHSMRLVPIMTPATHALLNLPVERKNLHGKWRNCLKKAENSGLRCRHIACTENALLDVLKADHQQQIDKSYRALPAEFSLQWQRISTKDFRLITASKNRKNVATALFILHGNTATYHIAQTSTSGRELSAQRLVLWRAFTDFTKQGIEQIDLGQIDTVNAAGLARFKLGTGAKANQFGSTVLAI